LLRDLLLAGLLVLALRAPFWNQAIQGDDIYYLEGARHAQMDPAHPHHARYVFEGRWVDMRGHPHPPGNAWILGGLVAVFGGVRENAFHAVYALLSWMAVVGVYWMARRWTTHPLWAVGLFCAVPAFVVNGTSFESDLPFLAFWMLGMGAFVEAVAGGRLVWLLGASLALAVSGLMAYQSLLAVPVLWLLLWRQRRGWWLGYAAALAPAVAVGAYQAFEIWSSGVMPLAVTAGYFEEYGLQRLARKARSAAALVGHLGWMFFPALALWGFRSWWMLLALPLAWLDWHPLYVIGVAAGIGILMQRTKDWGWWPQVYFAGIVVLVFAGSARYLLPLAAPVAVLLVERWKGQRIWLAAGGAAQLLLSLGLAWSNYGHWDGYRTFVSRHAREIGQTRTWTNGEWGLRFYGEQAGALPMERGQGLRDGDLILSSELSYPVPLTAQRVAVDEMEIQPALPLRLIGLGSRSGYSDATAGVRPFDWVAGAVDRVKLERVVERRPEKAYVTMADEGQLLGGFYQMEEGGARWMGRVGRVALKPERARHDVVAVIYLPPMAKARVVRLVLNGAVVREERLAKDGLFTVAARDVEVGMGDAVLSIECDATFQVAGDARELGLIVKELGLR
jgi:hypothetical protein